MGELRVCRGLHRRDDWMGLRCLGQRLVLSAVLRRLLRRLLRLPAHLRHGCLVQPAHRRLRARVRRLRSVWRRRHGRVVQPAHRHLRARCLRLRSVRIAVCGPGLQPPHRHLRSNPPGLERVRQLGDEQRSAWRQLGADRASRELPDRPDHERHSHQRGRGRRDAHGPKRGSDDCRPYPGWRRVCGPRRQRVSPQRRRGVGPEQRLRRLGTLGGHWGAAARSLHVRDDSAGRPARSRQRRAHPGKHADRGPRRLAKRWLYAVRCRELRRRRALAGGGGGRRRR